MDDRERLDARLGTVLGGRYELRRLLGVGGMGAVYEALHVLTERRVAVKLLLGEGASDPELVARFVREARAAARVEHPGVVEVLDMGYDADETPFIVYEFLAGVDLGRILDARGALPPREALEIAVPAMAALVAAHRRGVVHRDLKPTNLVVLKTPAAGSLVKVIDFGIARLIERGFATNLTRTGTAIGTPHYMSPEAVRGERDLGAEVDVWAMGVVLFEMLAGRPPFEGSTYNSVIAQVLTAPVPRVDALAPHVAPALADVVAGALERDVTRRHPTMATFLARLLDCPAYERDAWHQTLRQTHRIAVEPPDDEVDTEDLGHPTPSLQSAHQGPVDDACSGSAANATAADRFTEGPAWAPSRQALTTLGRTAREISAPTATPKRWRPVTFLSAVALVAALGGVGAGWLRKPSREAPALAAGMPVARHDEAPLAPRVSPVPAVDAAERPTSVAAETDGGSAGTRAATATTPTAPRPNPSASAVAPPRDARTHLLDPWAAEASPAPVQPRDAHSTPHAIATAGPAAPHTPIGIVEQFPGLPAHAAAPRQTPPARIVDRFPEPPARNGAPLFAP